MNINGPLGSNHPDLGIKHYHYPKSISDDSLLLLLEVIIIS